MPPGIKVDLISVLIYLNQIISGIKGMIRF